MKNVKEELRPLPLWAKGTIAFFVFLFFGLLGLMASLTVCSPSTNPLTEENQALRLRICELRAELEHERSGWVIAEFEADGRTPKTGPGTPVIWPEEHPEEAKWCAEHYTPPAKQTCEEEEK